MAVDRHANDLAEAIGKRERACGAVARERLFGYRNLGPRHAVGGGVCFVLAGAANGQRAIVGAARGNRKRRGGERARLEKQLPVLIDPPHKVRQRRQLPDGIRNRRVGVERHRVEDRAEINVRCSDAFVVGEVADEVGNHATGPVGQQDLFERSGVGHVYRCAAAGQRQLQRRAGRADNEVLDGRVQPASQSALRVGLDPDARAVAQAVRRGAGESVGAGVGGDDDGAVVVRRERRAEVVAAPPVQALFPSDAAHVVERASGRPGFGDRDFRHLVHAARPVLRRALIQFDNLTLLGPVCAGSRNHAAVERRPLAEAGLDVQAVRNHLADGPGNVNVDAHAGTTPSCFSSRVMASRSVLVSPVALMLIVTLPPAIAICRPSCLIIES